MRETLLILYSLIFCYSLFAQVVASPDGQVSNYRPIIIQVDDASSLTITMESHGDPYLRCYSTWIEDAFGGYINLEGQECGPEEWQSSHCSCPTVAGRGVSRYDLTKYVRTPYSGKVIVAVSSYVGYWTVGIEVNQPLE